VVLPKRPAFVVLGAATMVIVAYALMFPAFVKLINVGVKLGPNYAIWKHKTQFQLIQAAFLLADREPTFSTAALNGDAAAWYEVLFEAIQTNQMKYIPSPYDKQHTDIAGKFSPQSYTIIEAAELKRFCESKHRHPEFLN
jgi:hypothetical protein